MIPAIKSEGLCPGVLRLSPSVSHTHSLSLTHMHTHTHTHTHTHLEEDQRVCAQVVSFASLSLSDCLSLSATHTATKRQLPTGKGNKHPHTFLGNSVRICVKGAQGYLACKKPPRLIGPPLERRHSPTVGSYGFAVSHKRGTLVTHSTLRMRTWRQLVSSRRRLADASQHPRVTRDTGPQDSH